MNDPIGWIVFWHGMEFGAGAVVITLIIASGIILLVQRKK
jgi:hypothetical protein